MLIHIVLVLIGYYKTTLEVNKITRWLMDLFLGREHLALRLLRCP